MREIFLGEVIRQRRLELGLTQEQLCEGICEPVTVSRLERGVQTPSRNRINAILQRLGLPEDRYYAILSREETQISVLEKEIVAYNIRYERAAEEYLPGIRQEALEKHRQLEAVMDQDDTVARQLILRSRALLGGEDGAMSLDEQLQLMMDAIRLTSPGFDLEEVGQGLYTEEEIKIINYIAITYSRKGDHDQAADILKQLLRYIQKKLKDMPPRRTHIWLIAYSLCRQLAVIGRYKTAIEYAELGRDLCIRFRHYQLLPDFLAILAGCYYYLGDHAQSAALYVRSYYLYGAVDNVSNRRIIQNEAKAFLGIELPERCSGIKQSPG